MSIQHQPIVLFSSAARTATANSDDQYTPNHAGVVLILNITAASGTTPTLDIKLQYKDPLAGIYVDLPGAAFAQKTTTGTDSLTLFPGIAETANRSVSDVLPAYWRAVATIAGTNPSFTFSLNGNMITI